MKSIVKKLPKIFVLDTNVLLHDYKSIYKFQDNDIVIPLVTLEELDHFKKGNEQINYNAREIVRSLDKIAGQQLFSGGVSLGKGMGKISVALGKGLTEEMKAASMADIPDHRILAVALEEKKEHPDRLVYLVTKDVNLRMKAKAMGMPSDDYLHDKVCEEADSQTHRLKKVRVEDTMVAQLFESSTGINPKDLKVKPALNEYFKLEGPNS
ncbi:MAG: PIN domain-containing protein, partial [Bacteroidales bacterium]